MSRPRNFKLRLLLVSFAVTVALSFLARLFAPAGLISWRETAAAALVSLLVFHGLTVFFENKSRKVVVRYLLLALLVLSSGIYFYAAKTLLCDDVVVGTTLSEDFANERSLAMNQGRTKCDIFGYVAESDPRRIWTDVDDSNLKLRVSYVAFVVFLIAFFTHLTEEILRRSLFKDSSGFLEDGDAVFISYNHGNAAEAMQVRNELVKNGIKTIIDTESMPAGYAIEKFIAESIQQSQVILSIVSEESILSGWVATETINTFFLQLFDTDKKFIACYLDESFLKDDFPEKAYAAIDAKLEAINQKIDAGNRIMVNRSDLTDQKDRLFKLRQNLADILRRLKASKCIDIRGEKFRENVPPLVKEIKAVLEA
ncbi:toll/interleukin-1 receptor domain-containing protein [Flavisolibacter nicotianae]|uniref:toll/interleukin-1 receptor domain-containing protein n=1 Tax=Flavisolibacter nicotianae TaxID=2364882 RepID=UPI000EAB950C|nr:toll/interleukin-1 receptor domain-containing protein [Flavisolibacter nicotianae]